MPTERLAPDAILTQTNLTGALSAIQDDPDSPDANWLTAPALGTSEAKTFYILGSSIGAAGVNEHFNMQEGGSAPAEGAMSTATGWEAGTLAIGRSALLNALTEVSRTATTAPDWTTTLQPAQAPSATRGDSWRIPTAYTGSFAAGNWTLSMNIRSVTAGFAGRCRLRWRIWRSTNADGSGATEVTGSTIVSPATTANISNASNTVVSVTSALSEVILTNEYLFFQLGIEITASGTTNTQDIHVRRGSGAFVTTTIFSPKEPDTTLHVSMPTPTNTLTTGANGQGIRAQVRKKGTGTNPTLLVKVKESGTTKATSTTQTITNTTSQIVELLFDANVLASLAGANVEASVEATGAPAGSVEVGAIEWNATYDTLATNLTRSANSVVAAVTAGTNRAAMAKNRAPVAHVLAITAQTSRLAQTKVRAANAYSAAVTALANRQPMTKSRQPNSHTSSITSTTSRFTQKIRSALSHSNTITAISNAFTSINRFATATAWTGPVEGFANRFTSLSREADSEVSPITSSASRFKQLLRNTISHASSITSVTNVIKTMSRGASSWSTPITTISNRVKVGDRTTTSHVAALTSTASRIKEAIRMVNSHVEVLSSVGNRVTTLFKRADSHVADITGFSTSSIISTLFRTSTSHVAELSARLNRQPTQKIRASNSHTNTVATSTNRVKAVVRNALAYVGQITGLSGWLIPISPGDMTCKTKKKIHATCKTRKKVHCTVKTRKKVHMTVRIRS